MASAKPQWYSLKMLKSEPWIWDGCSSFLLPFISFTLKSQTGFWNFILHPTIGRDPNIVWIHIVGKNFLILWRPMGLSKSCHLWHTWLWFMCWRSPYPTRYKDIPLISAIFKINFYGIFLILGLCGNPECNSLCLEFDSSSLHLGDFERNKVGVKIYLWIWILSLILSSFSSPKLSYHWIDFGFGKVDFILYKKVNLNEINLNLFWYHPKVTFHIYWIICVLSYPDILD